MKSLRINVFAFYMLLLSLFAETHLYAQWKVAGPGLLPEITGQETSGAMTYKDGKVWAGCKNLWSSPDSGKTWRKLPNFADPINAIRFFDRNFGLIGVENGNVYLTRDGGSTWNPTIYTTMDCRGIVFGNTKNEIAVCGKGPILYISRNGGTTWTNTTTIQGEEWGHDIFFDHNKNLVMLASRSSISPSRIYVSGNFGTSWQQMNTPIDYDTYSLSYDSCAGGNFYALDEDYVFSDDNLSQIYSTSNYGNSWDTSFSVAGKHFTGSIECGRSTVYAPSLKKGVFRSSDQGASWKSIGGPIQTADSRLITVIDDNIILTCDATGNIWKTINSGGDSIVNAEITIPLAIQALDQYVDTIGGSAAIPIQLKGLPDMSDVDLIIHYDAGLQYSGTYLPNGIRLDVAGMSWQGRSKIHIPLADSSRILAYSHFDVLADSIEKLYVTFDSISALPRSFGPCNLIETFKSGRTTAIITPISGCGINILSHFMRNATIPQFSIYPNPSSGDIFLNSTLDIGEVEVNIYDMLGGKRRSEYFSLKKNSGVKLSTVLANGIYTLRVKFGVGSHDLRVIVNH